MRGVKVAAAIVGGSLAVMAVVALVVYGAIAIFGTAAGGPISLALVLAGCFAGIAISVNRGWL